MTENNPAGALDTEEAQIEAMLAPVKDNEPPEEDATEDETVTEPEAEEEADADEVEELAEDETEEEDEDSDFVEIYDPEEDTWKQVSRDEAKGYGLRQSDYTRKTQEIAEARKAAEAELNATKEQRSQLQQALAMWAVQPQQEPNWAELAQQYSPQEIFAAQHNWKQQQERSMQARQLYQQLQEQQRNEEIAAREDQKRQAVDDLLQTYPHWKDKQKANAELSEVVSVAEDYGFSQEELLDASFADARIIKTLMDLRELRKIRSANASAKRVAKPTKTLEPGARSTRAQSKVKREQEKLARVKKTGGDSDAFADWLLG